jgi:hypothetical protein
MKEFVLMFRMDITNPKVQPTKEQIAMKCPILHGENTSVEIREVASPEE